MKFKIFTFFLLLFYSVFFSQNTGDYQTNIAATPWPKDWTNVSAWQVYNGSAWVAATQYPGQNPPNSDANATVTISAGTIISNASAPASLNFKELIVKGTLQLYKDLTLSTPNFIIDGGTVYWMNNNVSLFLPANAVLYVYGSNGNNGIQSDGSCTNNRDLYIGGVKYSACNGSGNTVAGDFSYVNTNGGTLKSEPVATPENYCATALPLTVALKNADGLNAGITGLEYQWSFVSGPTTITIPSAWSTTSNITVNNLNAIGDYVFKLTVRKTISSGTYQVSGNVTVKIYQPVTSGTVNNINICSKLNTANVLTLSGYFGTIEKWQSALDIGFTNGVTDIANTTNTLTLANNISADMYYRAVLSNGVCSGYSAVASVNANATTYTGVWSNGTPDATKRAVFNASYAFPSDVTACAVEVRNNAIVTIPANRNLTVNGEIEVVSGNILVESDANLIQVRKEVTNSGNITVRRNAQLKRLDYNYWGSPVVGQNFKSFSPQTVNARFYTYNESDDSFASIPDVYANFATGKGYAIRAPNNYTTAVQNFVGEFNGVPNNGDVSIPVAYTNATRGKNMVANPYPSNLDLRILHQKNPSLSGGVFYFWTNDANSWLNDSSTSNGAYGTYSANQYAVLNVLGATPASTPADLSPKYPSAIIKPGQGFVMQASAAGNLLFDNTMRTTATTDGVHSSVFFNRTAGNGNNKTTSVSEIEGRYWLSLISPAGAKNVILVGYVKDAVNNFDLKYDAEMISNSSDNLYSIADGKKLTIQGRTSANMLEDAVPIGVTHYMPGTYKIQLENKDGVFNNGLPVFLKDKALNTITDLSRSSYTYDEISAGTTENRFEIIYRDASVLSSNENVASKEIHIFKKTDQVFTIIANKKINKILIYETSGKLIKEILPNKETFDWDVSLLPKGIYLVKTFTVNGFYTNKILK